MDSSDPKPAADEPTKDSPKPAITEVESALKAEDTSTPTTPQPAAIPNSSPIPDAASTAATVASAPASRPVSAGLVVLQWLTYAFWGWTVLGLSVLVSMVLINLIAGHDTGSFAPYGIAATLVLLPISFVCDVFYSKREPQHKAGAETLVMVIHAVLFALFGIGALIVSVFAAVQLLTSSTDASNILTALYSGLIITAFYGLTFLRTLNPGKFPWIKRWYKWVMLLAVGLFAVMGIVGPVAKERTLRDDRLIVSQLPVLQTAISSYADSNKHLPSSLQQVEVDNDTKQLRDRNLVTFKPEGVSYDVKLPDATTDRINNPVIAQPTRPVYKYQLCVNFKEKTSNYSGVSSYNYGADADGYATYLNIYDHPAGQVCYKIKTQDY